MSLRPDWAKRLLEGQSDIVEGADKGETEMSTERAEDKGNSKDSNAGEMPGTRTYPGRAEGREREREEISSPQPKSVFVHGRMTDDQRRRIIDSAVAHGTVFYPVGLDEDPRSERKASYLCEFLKRIWYGRFWELRPWTYRYTEEGKDKVAVKVKCPANGVARLVNQMEAFLDATDDLY